MQNLISKPLLIVAALFGGLLALAGGLWTASALFAPATLDTDALDAVYMPEGRKLPDFRLISHSGGDFSQDDFSGKWSLVFFGFTNCPDICPPTLITLAAVSDYLSGRDMAADVQTVFVTVDPDRDTPERLAAYVTAFDPRFIGVTGDLDNINILARGMGIAHIRHNQDGAENYMVDHGSAILLVNPDGRLQAVFTAPHRGGNMGRDVEAILAFHGVGS